MAEVETKERSAEGDQSTELTERIKALSLANGGDVVGIAPADRWNDYVPEGHRPYDILPGAKSVVVVGARGPSAGAWRSPDHRIMEVNGYDFADARAIHVVANTIEAHLGYYAIAAPILPVGGHQPPMSMMLSAVLAGLGTRSFAANIILNPKYGLLYYSACLTTLPLDYDDMLEQEVCPHPMCVQTYKQIGKTPCMAACPADNGGCLDGTIDEDGHMAEQFYDRERCATRSMNFGINSLQNLLAEIVNEEDKEKRDTMIYSDFFTRSCNSVSFFKESVAHCFECMRVCPVGRTERKLK